MMSAKYVNRALSRLVQLDVDAVRAYDQAIDHLDHVEIRRKLMEFRQDHVQHIERLSSAIRRNEGEPPERSRDVKGFVIEGFTAIGSRLGIEGALQAMRGNEKLTNAAYDEALELDLPWDVRHLVETHRDDERRHLRFIEKTLKDRSWESRTRA